MPPPAATAEPEPVEDAGPLNPYEPGTPEFDGYAFELHRLGAPADELRHAEAGTPATTAPDEAQNPPSASTGDHAAAAA
jgi:hypothetical protein